MNKVLVILIYLYVSPCLSNSIPEKMLSELVLAQNVENYKKVHNDLKIHRMTDQACKWELTTMRFPLACTRQLEAKKAYVSVQEYNTLSKKYANHCLNAKFDIKTYTAGLKDLRTNRKCLNLIVKAHDIFTYKKTDTGP